MPSGIQSYRQYMAQFGNAIEQIGGQLFDTLLLTSAATVRLTYFNAIRALPLSNLQVASILPAPQAFMIRAIRVPIFVSVFNIARAATTNIQTGPVNDMALLLNTGVLELTIGSKSYGQWPLWMLPQGSGPMASLASDGDTADPGAVQQFATNGEPDLFNVRALSLPIFIPPQVNFQVDLTWPAVVTLAAGNPNIQVILDGDLFRQVQ